MLISKLTEEETKQIENLKEHFRESTNSKVISILLTRFIPVWNELKSTRKELEECETKLALEVKQRLEFANSLKKILQ